MAGARIVGTGVARIIDFIKGGFYELYCKRGREFLQSY